MVRTRDFFLLLVIVVFLLVAIGTTLVSRFGPLTQSYDKEVAFVNPEAGEFTASVPDQSVLNRSERLFAMREKIQSVGSISNYAQEEPKNDTAQEETPPDEGVEVVGELRCANYSNSALAWNAEGIKVEEIEGLRLVYRDNVTSQSNASSSLLVPSQAKDILLKLPVRTTSQGASNCIATQVVGVTIGGSLINNTDAAIYAPFGESSLLGYALDGYPIYGTSGAALDSCGGRVVGGQYRYQLSNERDTILRCFSAVPVNI